MRPSRRTETIAAAAAPFHDALPLVAARNTLFLPRALGPIHLERASSRAAVEAALARKLAERLRIATALAARASSPPLE